MERRITDDLDRLKAVLPDYLVKALAGLSRNEDDLLEVILDLGRVPTARFVDEEVILDSHEVTPETIAYVAERVGDFDKDNRADRTHAASYQRASQPARSYRRGDLPGRAGRLWHD